MKFFGIQLFRPSPVLPPGVTLADPSARGVTRTPEQRAAAFAFEERWLRATGEITGPLANQDVPAHEPPGGNRVWTSFSDRCPNCGAPSQEITNELRRCIMQNCAVVFKKEE